MRERNTVLLAAGVLGLLLAGCTANSEPKTASSPEQSARPGDTKEGQVTVYVEGMTKVQGIT
jgi:hypothetical protein